jgi:hypothetical protein
VNDCAITEYKITVLSRRDNDHAKTENLIYPLGYSIIEVRVSPQREAKRKKMNSKEERGVPLNRTDVVPDCHGEKMQPILRYKEEGIVRRLFQWNFCGWTVSV